MVVGPAMGFGVRGSGLRGGWMIMVSRGSDDSRIYIREPPLPWGLGLVSSTLARTLRVRDVLGMVRVRLGIPARRTRCAHTIPACMTCARVVLPVLRCVSVSDKLRSAMSGLVDLADRSLFLTDTHTTQERSCHVANGWATVVVGAFSAGVGFGLRHVMLRRRSLPPCLIHPVPPYPVPVRRLFA